MTAHSYDRLLINSLGREAFSGEAVKKKKKKAISKQNYLLRKQADTSTVKYVQRSDGMLSNDPS